MLARRLLYCLVGLSLLFLLLLLLARPEAHLPRATLRPLPAPDGVDLVRAASALLLKGCGPASRSSGEGVACRADLGVPEVLSRPAETRFDPALTNPCTPAAAAPHSAGPAGARYCIPYFYVIGAFHAGVRDLFARINAHERAVLDYSAVAAAASPPAGATSPPPRSPSFFSETHPWERMLWRGCDWGGCPRRRGAGAEPIELAHLPGLLPCAAGADAEAGNGSGEDGAGGCALSGGRVFGEAAPAAFAFTWSSTFSLLHAPWTASIGGCLPRAANESARQRCYPQARAAQLAWEARTLGASAPPLSAPWLMRGVHGASKVRLIALLREPASRLYSAFWFWPQYRRRYGHSADGFDAYAREAVRDFEGCLDAVALLDRTGHGGWLRGGYTDELLAELRARSPAPRGGGAGGARALPDRRVLEACAADFESLSSATQGSYYHADQLLRSLYAAFLPAWLDAFGGRALLLLRAEDYWAQPRLQLARTFRFLGLPPPSEAAWARILAPPPLRAAGSENASYWGDRAVTNSLVRRPPGLPGAAQTRMRGPMRADTAELLSAFFRPYNAELARLAGDARFTWRDVPLPTAEAWRRAGR